MASAASAKFSAMISMASLADAGTSRVAEIVAERAERESDAVREMVDDGEAVAAGEHVAVGCVGDALVVSDRVGVAPDCVCDAPDTVALSVGHVDDADGVGDGGLRLGVCVTEPVCVGGVLTDSDRLGVR